MASATPALPALTGLVRRVCGSDTDVEDQDVLRYVASLLEASSVEDVEDSLGDWDQMLCGCCSGYASKHEETRLACLAETVYEVLKGAANPTSAGPSGNSANSTTIAHAFAFLALRQENIQDSGRRSSEEASGSEIRTDTQLSVDASLLDTLSDLCSEPGISRDFLAYVLCRRCAGDMQAAAAYLLDADGHVEALATDWAAAQQDGVQHAQEERVLRHKQKQAVLAKFDLQAVPVRSVKDVKGKPPALHVGQATAEPKKVRYLDGQVVSMKGEKFLVEKEVEWDGGSRGRVKTKGKRGTGWA